MSTVPIAAMSTCPIPLCWAARGFHGGLPQAPSWRRACGPVRGPFWFWFFLQGILYAGVTATLAMAAGTAITTGSLAFLAVHAKRFAQRLTTTRGTRGVLVLRGLELVAALAVLLLGLGLLSGSLAGGL
jgi:hypothetical protein